MKYSHKSGIAILGVLPEAKNNHYGEYSQNLCGSGPNHIEDTGCSQMDLGFNHKILSPYVFNPDLKGCYKEGIY